MEGGGINQVHCMHRWLHARSKVRAGQDACGGCLHRPSLDWTGLKHKELHRVGRMNAKVAPDM